MRLSHNSWFKHKKIWSIGNAPEKDLHQGNFCMDPLLFMDSERGLAQNVPTKFGWNWHRGYRGEVVSMQTFQYIMFDHQPLSIEKASERNLYIICHHDNWYQSLHLWMLYVTLQVYISHVFYSLLVMLYVTTHVNQPLHLLWVSLL